MRSLALAFAGLLAAAAAAGPDGGGLFQRVAGFIEERADDMEESSKKGGVQKASSKKKEKAKVADMPEALTAGAKPAEFREFPEANDEKLEPNAINNSEGKPVEASSKKRASSKKKASSEEKPDLGMEHDFGSFRLQCLSPTLLRIEPRGPQGYESRTTFMVVDRDWEGIPIRSVEEEEDHWKVTTDFYTVVLSEHFSVVFGLDGGQLYNSGEDPDHTHSGLLHWPPPLTGSSYAIADYPRFWVPPWAVTPRGDDADVKEGTEDCNGYDFGNNVEKDTYVFVFTNWTLESWEHSRVEFGKLTGEVPLLPDYAFGTWFTWWHPYKEWEAKADLDRWDNDELPIDIWGLDMNWRHIHNDWDREYNHPNDSSFQDLGAFLDYLKDDKKIHTFFNDHPYPAGPQMSPGETGFRWHGLTQWMDKGVSFWWYDHNWKFSIPPPFVSGSPKKADWKGLSTASWGSHVYFEIVSHYDKNIRDPAGDTWYGGRPITLSHFSDKDWEKYTDPVESAQSPSHHRYPVWWTGDAVPLQASVESMVDSGIFNYKPYVHSDCGGDYYAQAIALLRWTEHCTFGSIFRYHGSDHRPWIWGMAHESHIRQYLQVRYRMVPSLIAAGQKATQTGKPFVARCDLFWPEIEASRYNNQYMFIEDILVAPIVEEQANWSTRDVWIPPGDWQHAWDGSIIHCDNTVNGTWTHVSMPAEQIPLWFRRDGGLIVLVDEPKLRIADQDWSSLTLDAFPSDRQAKTERSVYERSVGDPPRTGIVMLSDGKGTVTITIGAPTGGDGSIKPKDAERAWTIRFNLRPKTYLQTATVDGEDAADIVHIYPSYGKYAARLGYFPLQGAGSTPAPLAGAVAEVKVPKGKGPHTVVVSIAKGDPPETALLFAVNVPSIKQNSSKENDSPVDKISQKVELVGDAAEEAPRRREWGALASPPGVAAAAAVCACLAAAGLLAPRLRRLWRADGGVDQILLLKDCSTGA